MYSLIFSKRPITLNGRSISEVWVKQFNIKPKVVDLMIRLIRLDGVAQQLLGCTNGAPGLQFKRIKTDTKGNVIQIDQEFWRFEMLELRFSPEKIK
jgi:DNA-binding GntR family transcriptional regulator